MAPAQVALAVALLALAACGRAPTPAPVAPAVPADDHARVTAGPVREVPADFPTDVHLPAVAYVIRSVARSPGGIALSLHSSQPRERLLAEYVAAMKAGGWQEVAALQASPTSSALSYRKDQRALTIVLTPRTGGSDEGTDIDLQLVTGAASR